MMIEKLNIYDTFSCTADRCPLTCCQEWKIAVDEDTYEQWRKVPADCNCLGKKVEDKKLADYVTYKDETRVIALNEEKQCPFLNEKKLCRLVLTHGDSMLSETCQIFPRQNSTYDGRKVYALMAGCPAVVDILKEQDSIEVIQVEGEEDEDILFKVRDVLMQLIKREDISAEEALQLGFIMMLNLIEDDSEEAMESVLADFTCEETLQEMIQEIREMDFQKVYTFEECNELFLDLAENYRKEGIYAEYLVPAAELAEEYEEAPEYEVEEDVEEFLKQYKVYDKLMRNYLVTEVFANLYLPEASLETVTMALQWIAMEYAAVRHGIFLQWVLSRQDEISYDIVRDAIVIVSRMTGYDEEDIQEYLENSFETPVWEWGYLALITGRI